MTHMHKARVLTVRGTPLRSRPHSASPPRVRDRVDGWTPRRGAAGRRAAAGRSRRGWTGRVGYGKFDYDFTSIKLKRADATPAGTPATAHDTHTRATVRSPVSSSSRLVASPCSSRPRPSPLLPRRAAFGATRDSARDRTLTLNAPLARVGSARLLEVSSGRSTRGLSRASRRPHSACSRLSTPFSLRGPYLDLSVRLFACRAGLSPCRVGLSRLAPQ
jgi:hypothetical protein